MPGNSIDIAPVYEDIHGSRSMRSGIVILDYWAMNWHLTQEWQHVVRLNFIYVPLSVQVFINEDQICSRRSGRNSGPYHYSPSLKERDHNLHALESDLLISLEKNALEIAETYALVANSLNCDMQAKYHLV